MWPSKSRRQTVDCESQVDAATGPNFTDEEEVEEEEGEGEGEGEVEREEEEEDAATARGSNIRSSSFWPLEWHQETADMRLAARWDLLLFSFFCHHTMMEPMNKRWSWLRIRPD